MTLMTKSRDSIRPRPPTVFDRGARWEAVRRRDKAADGTFFYSVRTTGVYCRPSCAARSPRRENVEFYETCKDAERAGFRPCKRCRPDGPSPAEQRAIAVYENASHLLGMTPTEFRAGGRNTEIRFAVGDCSLGAVLVAATQKGVCAIEFGDDPNALVRALQDRFPKAQLIGADRDFEQLVAKVVGLVEAPANGLDLPLDVRGTAFQQRVWRALRDIPPGSTTSYSEIARRIGRPKAVRAVAQACASNPLAVAIPCHRVVRQDGDRSGYRWGVERKHTLLDREAAR
jgi:AraC family transcriptional regulator of adaptative response/methylated-DNA-[protein]-cysteine methyltransferase